MPTPSPPSGRSSGSYPRRSHALPLAGDAPTWGPSCRNPCPSSARPARSRSTPGPGDRRPGCPGLEASRRGDRTIGFGSAAMEALHENVVIAVLVAVPGHVDVALASRRRWPGPNGWPGCSVTAIGCAALAAGRRRGRSGNSSPRRPCQAHHTLPFESVAETTLMSAPGSVVIRSIADHWFCGRDRSCGDKCPSCRRRSGSRRPTPCPRRRPPPWASKDPAGGSVTGIGADHCLPSNFTSRIWSPLPVGTSVRKSPLAAAAMSGSPPRW